MSNDTSHVVAGGYFALPFDSDGSITYNKADPDALHGKAVMQTGNRECGLATAGERVIGSIKVVEPTDGQSVKVTVQMGTAVPFRNSQGAPAVTPGEAIVGGATAGDIANAAGDGSQDGAARGVVTSIEDDGTIVVNF